MKEMIVILLSAILTQNFVLSKSLGICPFLGVSKKLDSAVGMSLADRKSTRLNSSHRL